MPWSATASCGGQQYLETALLERQKNGKKGAWERCENTDLVLFRVIPARAE
jgi:hypothetical protein